MITPDINNDISYYDLPKRKAVSLGKNNNMITPKINNNKECKARPHPAGVFSMDNCLVSCVFLWRSRLPAMGTGPRLACAPATALRCMPRPPRSPIPSACLRTGDLTAPPPFHRRLS